MAWLDTLQGQLAREDEPTDPNGGTRFSVVDLRDNSGVVEYDKELNTDMNSWLTQVDIFQTTKKEPQGRFKIGKVNSRFLLSKNISGDIYVTGEIYNDYYHNDDEDHRLTREDWCNKYHTSLITI